MNKSLRDKIADYIADIDVASEDEYEVDVDGILGIFHDHLLDVAAEWRAIEVNRQAKLISDAVATIIEGEAAAIFPKQPRKISETNTFFGPSTTEIFVEPVGENVEAPRDEVVHIDVCASVITDDEGLHICILDAGHGVPLHSGSFHASHTGHKWLVEEVVSLGMNTFNGQY